MPSPPSRPGRHPPLRLEVRLDALGAVVLDGLSYRRAARMVGICKTDASRHESSIRTPSLTNWSTNAVSRVGPTATVTVVTGPIAFVALAAPQVAAGRETSRR